MKLYSALYRSTYPFEHSGLFNSYDVANHPKDMDDPDSALVVWGGADIHPSLYNKPNVATNAGDRPSQRDQLEWALMRKAKQMEIPIIGICRGAQMLCALAGGHLIQDVTDHTRSHDVITNCNLVLNVSSLHHQMMFPFDVEHEMIAWSKRKLSRHYADAPEFRQLNVEPEYVYFPKVKGIAVQWHPEFMKEDTPANQYFFKSLERYLHV